MSAPESTPEAPNTESLNQLELEISSSIDENADRLSLSGDTKNRLLTPQNLMRVGAPAALVTVFGLGVAEGFARSHDWKFALVFGATQIPLSFTWWAGDESRTVADMLNMSPSIIRDLNTEVINGMITAQRAALERTGTLILYSLRGGIAGSALVGSITSALFAMRNAGEQMRARVLEGTEILKPRSGSVYFCGGESSGPMVALALSGLPIVPIVEKSDALASLFKFMQPKKRGNKPVGITIDNGEYEEFNFPEMIKVTKESLILTQDKRRLLVTVGDGSVYNEEFPLRAEAQQDLTIKELQIVTTGLEESAATNKVKIDESVRIYIGDANLETPTGSGQHTLTLREEVEKYKSVEVFIDSKAPLKQEILSKLDGKKAVVLHTKNQAYFQGATELLKDDGIKVYDQEDENIPSGTTIIVYEETTAASVQRAIEVKKLYLESRVVALTSSIEGHQIAEKNNVEDICSATVYRDTVLFVVGLLKLGYTPQIIQQILDERWGYPGLKIQKIAEAESNS